MLIQREITFVARSAGFPFVSSDDEAMMAGMESISIIPTEIAGEQPCT